MAADDVLDLHFLPGGPIPVPTTESPSGAVFFVLIGLMRPRARGSVSLTSADANAAPRIRTGGVDHPEDQARLVEAIRTGRRLLATEPLASILPGLEIRPGASCETDEDLSAYVRTHAGVYHHASGTCAMGADPASGAAVDADGHVHGIAGLAVADASVFPEIPAVNTNLPAIMVAEHLVDRWRGVHGRVG